MVTKASKATFSWYADILASTTVLILCASWIYSLQYPSKALLSPSFLENGFCLSPLFDNTHLSCSQFDFVCGIVCLVAVIFTRKPSWVGMAAYFFAHSYGHYEAAAVLTEAGATQVENIGTKDLIVLAAILSIGPLTSASDLIKSGKVNKRTGNTCSFLGLAAGVTLYAIFLKRPCYALLYINLFITLSISLPRCFLIGCVSANDVEIRSSTFHFASVASGLAILVVMFCEPFYCDSFMKHIGGHAVFDVVLALAMFIQVLSHEEQVQATALSKKDD